MVLSWLSFWKLPIWQRLSGPTLAPWDRRLLLLACLVYCIEATFLMPWYVDDAAISFTFARNLGEGLGLVLYPGGERVEAYSNPLWVFLLAPGSSLSVSPFHAAKAISLLLGLLCLQRIVFIGSRLLSLSSFSSLEAQDPSRGDSEPGPSFPLGGVAAFLVATHPPFAAWTNSGLEGALYVFLLVLALEQFMRESQFEKSVPWSGLTFFLISITRPEGALFFVTTLAVALMWDLWRNGFRFLLLNARRWLLFIALFSIPYLIYHLWHFAYFATFVTNTWYVKGPESSLLQRLFSPDSSGVRYVGSWLEAYRLTWLSPLVALPFSPRDRTSAPQQRRWVLLGTAMLTAVFFPILADGDWMREFRFMMPVMPFAALLIAGGLEVIFHSIPYSIWRGNRKDASPLWLTAVLFVFVFNLPAITRFQAFVKQPEVSVEDVRARVDFFREAKEKLGLKGEVVYLDPDLGASSYYSQMQVADTWGLGHVPFAVHGDTQSFVADYVLTELRPHFAHVFGYWNKNTRILDDSRWSRDYIALPSYRMRNGTLDGGNYVARRLLLAAPVEYPKNPTAMKTFESGLELLHARFLPEAASPGETVRLVLYWRVSRKITSDVFFRTRLEREGSSPLVLDHPPVYGWYGPSQWREREVVKESLEVQVPLSQLEGEYVLSVQVVNPNTGVPELEVAQEKEATPLPRLQVGAQAVRQEKAQLIRKAHSLMESGKTREALEAAELAASMTAPEPESLQLLEQCRAQWRDQLIKAVESQANVNLRQASEMFHTGWWRFYDDAIMKETGQKLGIIAFEQARVLDTSNSYARAFEAYLAAVAFDPRLSMARRRAEALRLRREAPTSLLEALPDATKITALVLGAGNSGKVTDVRHTFGVGENVVCQVFWAEGLRKHSTRWLWFDPEGIKRFDQKQLTEEKAGMSYGYITLPNQQGRWTVEVWVNSSPAGVMNFLVVK